jgi:flagellar protein FliT
MNDRLTTEEQIVERYARMADASQRMLNAARRDDWDQVCEVEKECTRLIAELSTMSDLVPTDPVLRDRKLGLLKRVLADDAEIRHLSQPWMKRLDALLRSPETVARLDRAYGTGAASR